jgi:hypothetical protein
LARVNAVILQQELQSGEGVVEAPGAREAGRDSQPRPGHPTIDDSGFLGVAERGLPLIPVPEASLEAWKRLRVTLANEIVSTATEITLRVRASS